MNDSQITERDQKPIPRGGWTAARALIIGLTAVIVVLGAALIILAIGGAGATPAEAEPINALAQSTDECVTCHRRTTPGIVEQYGHSTMAAAEVTARTATKWQPTIRARSATKARSSWPRRLRRCARNATSQEVAQFNAQPPQPAGLCRLWPGSEDSARRYAGDCTRPFRRAVLADKSRRATPSPRWKAGYIDPVYLLQPATTSAQPAADGSVGQVPEMPPAARVQPGAGAQARNLQCLPYRARPPAVGDLRRIAARHRLHDQRRQLALGGRAGHAAVSGLPGATCAICHMSGFGATGTTHDVGDRLTWFLFAPVSERRPGWQDNKVRMQSVCQECHNANFIEQLLHRRRRGHRAGQRVGRESDADRRSAPGRRTC